jgi:hypothetical protein
MNIFTLRAFSSAVHGRPGKGQSNFIDGPGWREREAGGRPFTIYHEMNDCRWYAADQKAKYDDDDRFIDWPPH